MGFAFLYLQKKSKNYLSNGLAYGLCNFINLAKRGEVLVYMPGPSSVGIGEVARIARSPWLWLHAFRSWSRVFFDVPPPDCRRTVHRTSSQGQVLHRYSSNWLRIVSILPRVLAMYGDGTSGRWCLHPIDCVLSPSNQLMAIVDIR